MVPFAWIVANVDQNIVHDGAARFGVRSPIHYLGLIAGHWRWALPVLLFAIRPAIGQHRALFATAVVHIVLLSMIGHKEYRFILLSTTLLVMLAAFGSVDLVQAWSSRRSRPARLAAWGVLLLAWSATSATLATSEMMRTRWSGHSPELNLMAKAGQLPTLCGIALDRQRFWQAGGYTYLHRDVPIYLTHPTTDQHIAATELPFASAAFDVVITPGFTAAASYPRYRTISCDGAGAERMCLLQRPGGCRPDAARRWSLPAVMNRHHL